MIINYRVQVELTYLLNGGLRHQNQWILTLQQMYFWVLNFYVIH